MMSPSLRPGDRLGAYTIVLHLGSGGMGDVYLGEDTRLGRRVALKVLQPEVAGDASMLKRFEREARAASALNHPSILTIYELATDGDVTFIVSEYIEGHTLRARLDSGPLPPAEAAEIATQIASALSVAHAAGIVHRDIKPENVMIRADGLVKLLDFGLAKHLEPVLTSTGIDEGRTTEIGTVVGTVYYMSPEQARGKPLDGRSDIFSLGTVLYEMVAGQTPFDGETWSHIMIAILEREPPPLEDRGMQAIVAKALQKDPSARYQSAAELLVALRAPATVVRRRPRRRPRPWSRKPAVRRIAAIAAALAVALLSGSVRRDPNPRARIPIAVADFDNQTGEPALDNLSGMLITSLEQSRRLSVMSRTRMYDILKGLGRENVRRVDERLGRDISRAENLHALVTGSVTRFGGRYIIDLKVLDPATNEYRFSARSEGRGQESIPELLDDLSNQLRLGLDETESDVREARTDLRKATTPDLAAYRHYFIGEQSFRELKYSKAEGEFRLAVERDPRFAVAWYRMAECQWWLARTADTKKTIAHALALSSDLPLRDQLTMRSLEAATRGDFAGGALLRQQVLAITPDDKEALYNAGDYSFHGGRREAAIGFLRRVLELDPAFEHAHQHLVWAIRNEGRFAETLETTAEYLRRLKTPYAWMLRSHALLVNGRTAEAMEAGRQVTDDGTAPVFFLFPAYLRLNAGDVSGALREARAARNSPRAQERFAALHVEALAAVYEGRYREAARLYDRAIAAAPVIAGNGVKKLAMADQAQLLAIAGEAAISRAVLQQIEQVAGELDDFVWSRAMFANFELRDSDAADAIMRTKLPDYMSYRGLAEGHRALFAGNANDALAAFRNVVRQDPHWSFVARSALEAGRYDEAREAALRTLPSLEVGYYGAFDRALNEVRVEYILGRCEEARGRRQAARAHYERLLTIGARADAGIEPFADAKVRLAKLGTITSPSDATPSSTPGSR